MVRQPLKTTKPTKGKVYNFIEYKGKKPFFLKPIKINIGSPINDSYYLIENVVYKGKQILALKQEPNSQTIFLVEAKIENGQLITISKLPTADIGDVSKMIGNTCNMRYFG